MAADNGQDLRHTGERIEALLSASSAHGAMARERAEELVRLVVDLYGAGLERMLDLLYEAGRFDEVAREALAADELVAGLLLVHGLHPHDAGARVERALEGVRPYLRGHAGDVELVEITPSGTVRVRLLGSCDGCASSALTLESAVRGAVEAAAPEMGGVEVVPAEPAPALIPVSALRSRPHEPPGECPVPPAVPR